MPGGGMINSWITFLIGLMVGGTVGVVLMALMIAPKRRAPVASAKLADALLAELAKQPKP